MDFFNIKSEKGGYNQVDVLKKIDAYNALLFMTEGKPDRDKILAELEKIKKMPLRREKTGFFSKTGFSVKDTEEYLAKFEEEIERKI